MFPCFEKIKGAKWTDRQTDGRTDLVQRLMRSLRGAAL